MDACIFRNPQIDDYIHATGMNYLDNSKSTEEAIRSQMKLELSKVHELLQKETERHEIDDFSDFLMCCTLYICLGMHKMHPQYQKALQLYKCPVVVIANIDRDNIEKALKQECFNMSLSFISYDNMLQNIPSGMEDSHPYMETFRICSNMKNNPDLDKVHIRIEFEPNDYEAFWRDDVISSNDAIGFFKDISINHCCFNDMCNKEATKICSVCKEAWYCSIECQKLNWKEHKTNCHAKSETVE
jgi:hypothetical protein